MGRKKKPFVEEQVDRLLIPLDGDITFEKVDWLKFILEFTQRTEAGKWDEKYNVMIFRANYGYQSAMKKIVKHYISDVKAEDSKIIVMTEIDDNKVKTWIVGNSDNIKKMVEDELKSI